jgi:heptosyltransferase I
LNAHIRKKPDVNLAVPLHSDEENLGNIGTTSWNFRQMTSRIGILLPNNLGDVIMALPALAGLKGQDPSTEITFFVEKGYEGGLINNSFCDRVFSFDRNAVRAPTRTAEWQRSIDTLSGSVTDLQGGKPFDRVINLSQHPYVSLLAALVQGRTRVGQHYLRDGNHAVVDPWSRYLYAIPFARRYNRLHASDIYRKIAGVKDRSTALLINVTDDERQWAAGYLSGHGIDPAVSRMMVLQPGAALPSKRWPAEQYVSLGKLLAADGFHLVVTGAPSEAEIARAIAAQIGEAAIVTAGSLTFRQTIALLPFVQGCVTGDTAIMHAAAALWKTVYALFGPTSPVETGPYGEGHLVFCGRCTTRPCFCFDCKNHLCMKSIDPSVVFSYVNGAPVKESGCDVYRTGFDSDGIVRLDTVVEKGPRFFNPLGAMTTRRVPDPAFLPAIDTFDNKECAQILLESEEFCGIVEQMAESLAAFDRSKSVGEVRRFEERRASLAETNGIAAFWAALLNLRLNSVSMIDPVSGIRASREECLASTAEIRTAIAVLERETPGR